MLTEIGSIKFIGDLSLQDADVFAKYGKKSKYPIEFGAGGSTHILAQCGCQLVTTIETDPNWIHITEKRLSQIENRSPVTFFSYSQIDDLIKDKEYDFVFVDGVLELRGDFAHKLWKHLKPNGVMIFHDTRYKQQFDHAMYLSSIYFNEIELIEINARASDGKSSNMTVIHKKEYEPYVNWNYNENKPLWSYGSQPNTEDFPLWSQK